MIPHMRHHLLIIGMLIGFLAPASAQEQAWSLSAEAGWGRAAGTSCDPATGAAFRPATTLVMGLGVHRRTRGFELGILLRTAGSDLTIADHEVSITSDDFRFRLYQLALELGTKLARVSRHADLRVGGGPVVDLWRVTGSESRVRVGARAAVTFESLVTDGVSGVVRAEGVVTGSVFNEGDLPPEFDRRQTSRVLIALGVRYRWQ